MLASAIRTATTPRSPDQAFANAFLENVLGTIGTRPPLKQTTFDGNGHLNPGIVDPIASPERQAAQLTEHLRSQAGSEARANLPAQQALNSTTNGRSAIDAVAQNAPGRLIK